MKVAIFFSGKIRSYEKTLEYLLHLRENIDITFFASHFGVLSDYEKQFIQSLDIKQSQVYECVEKIPDIIYDNFLKYTNNHLPNIYKMFYCTKKNIELIENYEKENNCKFDIVVKYRCEAVFCGTCNEKLFLEVPIDENEIFIPYGNDFGGINDQIAFGTLKSMKKYSFAFDRMLHCYTNAIILNPETILLQELHHQNVNIKRIDFKYVLHQDRRVNDPSYVLFTFVN